MPELLTVQQALDRHRGQVLAAIREPKLQGLIWEATLACNLACSHCGNPVEGKEGDGAWQHAAELDTHEIKRILTEIAEDFDPAAISLGISGGEATLRKDLAEVIAHAKSLGFAGVSLTTNCTLTGRDPALVDRLVAAGLDLFLVSLDGMKEAHDRQRGIPGSFDHVVSTIRYVRERHPSIRIAVNTIATPTNWRDIPEVHRLLSELKVGTWHLGPVSPVGRAVDPSTHLTNEQLRDLLEWIAEKSKPANVEATGVRVSWVCDGWVGAAFEGRVRADGMFFCGAGTRIASILYDGKAGTCLEVRRDIAVQGDLRHERMKDVWDRKYAWFRGDREKFRKGPCATCTEWDWCQGSSLHLREADGTLVECIYHRQSQAAPRDEALPTVIETAELAPLTIVKRDGVWIVGNEETGTFAEMPDLAVMVLRELQREPRVEAVRATIRQRLTRDVDVAAFVRSVARGGFVARLNGRALPAAAVPKKRRTLFDGVKPEQLRWMRGWAFWAVTLVPFALALAAMAADPFYRPSYRDFFFTDWFTIVGLVTFTTMGVLILKHELSHVLMARALGARASLSVGTRVAYVAVQTDATNLWILPKVDRMKVYGAGVASEAFVAGVLTILLALGHTGAVPVLAAPLFVGVAKLAILAAIMLMAFQAFFHLRTDLYYVLAHALDCRNLYGDAQAWLRKRFSFLSSKWRAEPEPNATPREMRWIRVYGVLHFVGVAVLLAYFGLIILPALATAYGWASGVFWAALAGPGATVRDLADAALFVGVHAMYFAVLGLLHWRDRRRDATGVVAAPQDEATQRLLAHPAPEGMTRSAGGRLSMMGAAGRKPVSLGPHIKAAALRAKREEAPRAP